MPARKKTKGQLPTPTEYERATIAEAIGGDADAGKEALDLFVSGVDAGNISPELLRYVADRIGDIVHGAMPPDEALRIKTTRTRGPEYDPLEVAATYYLLLKRKFKPEEAKAAMQKDVFNKKWEQTGGIDRRLIERTAATHHPMQNLDDELLLHLTGSVRKLVADLKP